MRRKSDDDVLRDRLALMAAREQEAALRVGALIVSMNVSDELSLLFIAELGRRKQFWVKIQQETPLWLTDTPGKMACESMYNDLQTIGR